MTSVVLGWVAWTHPNFIIWLVLILSLPRIVPSSATERTEEEQRLDARSDRRARKC